MCKESVLHGLHKRYHSFDDDERKPEKPLVRGRFVIDGQDEARLLERVRHCPRKL